jgi:hypothetical protein
MADPVFINFAKSSTIVNIVVHLHMVIIPPVSWDNFKIPEV